MERPLKFRRRRRVRLRGWLRFKAWLSEQWQDFVLSLLAALMLAAILVLLVLSGTARADKPQVVNRGSVTCPCALNGAEGACATTAAWLNMRDLKLRSELCSKQLEASLARSEHLEKAVDGHKAALVIAQSATSDLQRALESRRQQVESLEKALQASQTFSHSRTLWALIGIVVGTAATIGVGYALKNAR